MEWYHWIKDVRKANLFSKHSPAYRHLFLYAPDYNHESFKTIVCKNNDLNTWLIIYLLLGPGICPEQIIWILLTCYIRYISCSLSLPPFFLSLPTHFSLLMTIDKNFKALFFSVHRFFRFSDLAAKLNSACKGLLNWRAWPSVWEKEKNFRVHRKHFPDWPTRTNRLKRKMI